MTDLPEWDVTVMMQCRDDDGIQYRPFRLRMPCVDREHAEHAAVQLGVAVNEGSGCRWKITNDIDVREVRRG